MPIETMLLISILVYLIAIVWISVWAQSQVSDPAEFLVAGRRLPLIFSTATLFATWFGAGTLLTATDEVRLEGLSVSGLEPYGAGACLILAGLFFARPLWEMKLFTISDFYREKFGKTAEALSVVLMVPGYVGWIAVQLVASAGILEFFFGLPLVWGIVAVTFVAGFYTLLGGMWSVTLTDFIQTLFILAGIIVLAVAVFPLMGDGIVGGIEGTLEAASPDHRVFVPHTSFGAFFGWLNLFLISALGNIPGQDIGQRIFAANSPKTAKWACIFAGILYVGFGTFPILLGLASQKLIPGELSHSVIPALAKQFLSPAMVVVFMLSILSVVLSTVDSAILATASLISQNLLMKRLPKRDPLALCKGSVIFVALLSMSLALVGERAYSLLELSYASGFVGLFVPLLVGLYFKTHNEKAMIASMFVGIGIWSLEWIVETDLPLSLIAVAVSFVSYFVFAYAFGKIELFAHLQAAAH